MIPSHSAQRSAEAPVHPPPSPAAYCLLPPPHTGGAALCVVPCVSLEYISLKQRRKTSVSHQNRKKKYRDCQNQEIRLICAVKTLEQLWQNERTNSSTDKGSKLHSLRTSCPELTQFDFSFRIEAQPENTENPQKRLAKESIPSKSPGCRQKLAGKTERQYPIIQHHQGLSVQVRGFFIRVPYIRAHKHPAHGKASRNGKIPPLICTIQASKRPDRSGYEPQEKKPVQDLPFFRGWYPSLAYCAAFLL